MLAVALQHLRCELDNVPPHVGVANIVAVDVVGVFSGGLLQHLLHGGEDALHVLLPPRGQRNGRLQPYQAVDVGVLQKPYKFVCDEGEQSGVGFDFKEVQQLRQRQRVGALLHPHMRRTPRDLRLEEPLRLTPGEFVLSAASQPALQGGGLADELRGRHERTPRVGAAAAVALIITETTTTTAAAVAAVAPTET
ncbi:uncharacterized protein Tco025E_00109 [Trypanosoma conorhini]|uniref:Uncharacterized protein n=1 Tax=Trypanosoma conorhini TaxID=83891 RepID=A0A422QCS4_9TRYP|nr:uncharacterized protein Tco025E_00109 [Trypanosoma conorhini]RNF27725.1 hypothetical protein Tco025E_00109 [Trypanosoma conorhini]